jgi:predicted NAD-dependent protein-ADP-ribosyltransferase YbiA (DUF1768 family)
MHAKALLFNDVNRAYQILETRSPVEARQLGRKVEAFEKSIWVRNNARIIEEAVRYKFYADEKATTR